MKDKAIQAIRPLRGVPWETADPFMFCVHHYDLYPHGNEDLGPAASLTGRRLGSDFSGKDGWSMYHGDVVPGFPQHPHTGFETVTLARQGLIDHSDSLGATARFGQGDAQWMTAGNGIVHSEMFPLLNQDAPNPTELFQLWLNLPKQDKQVPPYFTMFWRNTIPTHSFTDSEGHTTTVTTVAGALEGKQPPSPPPNSWASRPEAHIAIWTIKLAPHASWVLPGASSSELNRSLYFFKGESLEIAGQSVSSNNRIILHADAEVSLKNGSEESELLLLQGKPIGEPVAQHGPFVANTREELQEAFYRYRKTGFGGWPFDSDAPTHERTKGRFAIHADGTTEEAPKD